MMLTLHHVQPFIFVVGWVVDLTIEASKCDAPGCKLDLIGKMSIMQLKTSG